jgi:hypothetical protein
MKGKKRGGKINKERKIRGGTCKLRDKHSNREYGKRFKTIIRAFYYKNFPVTRFYSYKPHHQYVSVKRFVSLLCIWLARRSNLCSQDYPACIFELPSPTPPKNNFGIVL